MNRLDFIVKPPNFYEWLKVRDNGGGSPSPSPSPLPPEYRQVEYLESTGTQYIVLPWTPDIGAPAASIRNVNDRFKIKFSLSGDLVAPFGSRYSYMITTDGDFWARCINDSSSNILRSVVPYSENIQEWEYSDGKLYANGDLLHDFWDPIHGSSGFIVTMHLFGRSDGNTNTRNGNIKIYYFERTKDLSDTETDKSFSLLPCIRIADSKPGFYDTIGNVFFTNDGTGEFITP